MKLPFFDALALQRMASGHNCLNLSTKVDWDEFPEFADHVLEAIKGKVLDRSDAADIRLWILNVGGCKLRFVFDDYPAMVSLESFDTQGDILLEKLHEKFSKFSL
jgi:hypothetical protein